MKTIAARELRTGRVRDVMQMHMVTVVPEMTVRELAQTLLDGGVRSAPVLGPTGKVVGIVTQAAVTRLAFAALTDADAADPADVLRVRDIMGPVGDTIAPDEALSTLVRRFLRGRENQLLVVDRGMLLGIVTPVDVLGAIDAVL
ncbi:MAG TPA: CBS domain-containing protein [Longimicrobium sp.]|jgi:CBS-domain-containing membrane protein|uniref:CBS domain-containing protein n=1 Tax=Longimicrobium sp. TaxID=2029185 RepID=UPI002EDB877B